jgi:hypothetical protein
MSKLYNKEIREYVTARLEQTDNSEIIAREVKVKFGLTTKEKSIARRIRFFQERVKIEKKKQPIKRLFADIEKGYYKAPVWGAFKQFIRPEMLEGEAKIICISYKWEFSDQVHTVTWDWQSGDWSDLKAVKKFIKLMGEADEIIGHNWDRFDEKQIRTRALLNGVLMYPHYRTLDTLKKSRKFFAFPSNKLDYLGKVNEIGRKKEHAGFDLWRRCQEGISEDPKITGTKRQIQKEALKEMVEYCEQDVLLLEEYFTVISPYIDHNTNFAVLKGGEKWQCPECSSSAVEHHHKDTTPKGFVHRWMRCKSCNKQYKISNRSYMKFLTNNYEVN